MMHVRRFAFAKLTLVALLTICFTFAIGFLNAAPELAMAGGAQGVPSAVGQWSPVFNWGVPGSPTTPPSVAIHTSVLPNGKVLTWQRVDSLLSTDTYLWDPATGGFTKIHNPNSHMFCSGHSFLPDGRLLVAGGHRFYDGDGEVRTNIFDYTTNTWSLSGNMNAGRWYPTNTTLGNGEVLTVSGIYWDGTYNSLSTTVTCDNSFDLYFDGVYRGSGSNWPQAQTFKLAQHAGKNVIAIKCMDAGGVAGLLADIQSSGGGSTGSNTSWKVSLTAPANWADPNFDDSGWANATDYGAYGVGPWGTNVVGMPVNTLGRWIWSSNNNLDDVVYIRATFNGDSSGAHHHVSNSLPQVWQASGTWRSLTNATRDLPLYPWMLLAPDGRVFYAGPDPVTRFLDTTGVGSWSADLSALNTIFRDTGSAVMYDVGKVLITGGGSPPTNTTQVINIDPASGPPAWSYVGSMNYQRRQMNTTVLPDGKVLATGGTSSAGFNDATGSVFAAEMWDPATGNWTVMASMQERRLYHSTAVLLPDGRVLSLGGGMPAGSGIPDSDHTTAEIYSPPYLFKGARPTITSAPTSAGYGQTFFVQTPDSASITKVTLVRLSSVTHTFNENQRFINLNFTKVAGGLNVTAPANGNVCPPGHYMMFILTGTGGNLVPSVAKIIRMGPPSSTPPSVTTGVASSIGQNSATLNATVNPNGTATTCFFEWGTTTSYGNTTPQISAGSGTSPVSIGANLTGLSANTTYHFRIVANNAGGNSVGSDRTFTTTGSPATASIAWIKPSEFSWGPPNTMTVAGYAQNGSGGVQLVWRDVTINGPWNVVGFQPTPNPTDNTWSNTIPSSNRCHTYSAYVNYSGIQSAVFTYNGLTSGYCNEAARVIWIQPQTTAGFGPPGSLVIAGSATNAPSGTQVYLWYRNITTGTAWTQLSFAPVPGSDGIWYNSIPNANFFQQYQVYVIYDAITSSTCTYAGTNSISWCP